MSEKPLPEIEAIREFLSYCPDTGIFIWNSRPEEHFKTRRAFNYWTNKFCGKQAIGTDTKGYGQIYVCGRMFKSHRLAWALHYREWPSGLIDHRNEVKNDNRISNLRISTDSQNCMNRWSRKTNTSGFKGVHVQRGKYVAVIGLNRRPIYLGTFSDIKDAAEAYRIAAEKYHGEFAHAGAQEAVLNLNGDVQ